MKAWRTGAEPEASTSPDVVPSIELRELRTLDELRACVALQREIWGSDFADVVPATLLKINREVGGVTAGAFTADDELIGFVYGLTGIRNGHATHWSHMLGVRKSHRKLGVGLGLKHFQRKQLLARGVKEMRWTFDPLVAGNAHFNLNLLHARIEAYVVDMYGDTGSGIHAFGMDRFISRWDLTRPDDLQSAAAANAVDWEAAPSLNGEGPGTSPQRAGMENGAAAVRIAIPRNVFRLKEEGGASAMEWRHNTREAFLLARDAGFRVVGFSRDDRSPWCSYLLLNSP